MYKFICLSSQCCYIYTHTHTSGRCFLYSFLINCDRLWENRAQRGMRRRRKKIDLVLKIVLNKPNEGNG